MASGGRVGALRTVRPGGSAARSSTPERRGFPAHRPLYLGAYARPAAARCLRPRWACRRSVRV